MSDHQNTQSSEMPQAHTIDCKDGACFSEEYVRELYAAAGAAEGDDLPDMMQQIGKQNAALRDTARQIRKILAEIIALIDRLVDA